MVLDEDVNGFKSQKGGKKGGAGGGAGGRKRKKVRSICCPIEVLAQFSSFQEQVRRCGSDMGSERTV